MQWQIVTYEAQGHNKEESTAEEGRKAEIRKGGSQEEAGNSTPGRLGKIGEARGN